MKEYTLGFCIDRMPGERQVLLCRHDKEGPSGLGWNGIGGKLEPGETPLRCMMREWTEETALEDVLWHARGSFGNEHYRVHLFLGEPFRLGRPAHVIGLQKDMPTAWHDLRHALTNTHMPSAPMVTFGSAALALALEPITAGSYLELR